MDEVDQIILKDLREVGCQIPDDVQSLKELKADILTAAVLKCLKIVDKDRDYPRAVPKNTIQKVNFATQLVNRIMEMGFQGELSYHQLLYPNEADTRKVLMWFQDKLPKPDERPNAQGDDRASIVNRSIDDEFTYLLSEKAFWVPSFFNPSEHRGQVYWGLSHATAQPLRTPASQVYFRGFQRKTAELEKYFENYQPYLTEQPTKENLAISVFEYNMAAYTEHVERDQEWNSLGLESGLNPMQYLEKKKKSIRDKMVSALRASLDRQGVTKKFVRQHQDRTGLQRAVAFDRESADVVLTETEEEMERRREQERQEADARFREVEQQVKDAERKIQTYTDEIRQMRAALQAELARTGDLKKQHDQLKTVMDLLPDAKNNIERLRQLARENAEKIKTLAADWEKYRQPLVEKYRSIRDKMHDREEQAKKQLEEIKEMRAKMKEMVEEINKKDEKYKQLLEVYKTLPKDNRSNYTRRILEMVKNVKKQIIEINKILVDTRNLQKEINTVTETLNRTFTVVEETVFQDAPKDPVASTVYKKLAAMNESFQKLIETVEQTGGARNDILVLEEKIAKIASRTSALNMESIEADLKQVKAENAKLVSRLRELCAEKNLSFEVLMKSQGEAQEEEEVSQPAAPTTISEPPGAGQAPVQAQQPIAAEPVKVEALKSPVQAPKETAVVEASTNPLAEAAADPLSM